jgi:hypothetical protein
MLHSRLTDEVNRPDCQPGDEWGTDRRKHNGRLAARGSRVGLNVRLGVDVPTIEASYRIAADDTGPKEPARPKMRNLPSVKRSTPQAANDE